MDADAELGEVLAIMFTVTASGLLVIIIVGTGVLRLRTRRSIVVSALLCSLLAAFWAWGLIRVKRLSYWLQRNGRPDQTFPLMPIHLFEIASSLMMLLITLLFHVGQTNLQGMVRMVMERLGSVARPSVLLFFLVGLAITGYGMGVFFDHADSGVYFIATGLLVIGITCVCSHLDTVGHMAGVSLIVYVFVLLVVTNIAGDWQHNDFDFQYVV